MGQWSEFECGHVVVVTPSHKASRRGLVYKSEMAPPPRPNPARRKQTAGTTERNTRERKERKKTKGSRPSTPCQGCFRWLFCLLCLFERPGLPLCITRFQGLRLLDVVAGSALPLKRPPGPCPRSLADFLLLIVFHGV